MRFLQDESGSLTLTFPRQSRDMQRGTACPQMRLERRLKKLNARVQFKTNRLVALEVLKFRIIRIRH